MAFDLANLLKPVSVRTSFLGKGEVDARKQSFYDWVRQGLNQKRWADPLAFVRSLLAEQTRLSTTNHPPNSAQIDALTPRQLNAFAKAFIRAAGKLIVPRMIQTSAGGRLRARRDDEGYSDARRGGETEGARLLRLLSDLDEERRTSARQQLADMRKMLECPADLFRRLDPIDDQLNKLRQQVLGPSTLAQMTAASLLREQQTSRGLAYSRELSRAIDATILGRHTVTEALRQQDYLASQIAAASNAGRANSVFGLSGSSRLADNFLARIEQQTAWGESVRRFLQPSFASGLLASMIGVQHGIAASAAIEAAAGLSGGFMTAANLGLAGLSAPGAVAAILSEYRADPSRHSDLFRDVMRGIQLADAGELVEQDLSESLGEARRHVRGINLRDPAQLAVLIALITLLLMVLQTKLQYDGMEQGKSSATPADVQATQAEVRDLREDLRRRRADDQRIRYVTGITLLRAAPDRAAPVLLRVYPDQVLRVIEAEGAWARVEVISYSSGATQSGWIARRNLRVQPAD